MKRVFASRFGIAWCLIFLATLNALGWTILRWRYEHQFGRVQMIVDWDDAKALADAAQVPRAQVLRALKNRGVGAVAVAEQTLWALRAKGRLSVIEGAQARRMWPGLVGEAMLSRGLMVRGDDPILMRQIEVHLRQQASPEHPVRAISLPGGARGLIVDSGAQTFNDTALGFDPSEVAQVRAAGLQPVAVFSNRSNLNAQRVGLRLDEARQIGARLVFFDGKEAFGYATLLPIVARELEARGLALGVWEFAPQLGLSDLMPNSSGNLVRAHIVSPEETENLRPDVLAERYVRAARERKVRALWLRLPRHLALSESARTNRNAALKADDLLGQNLAFVDGVRRGLNDVPAWAKSGPGQMLSPALQAGMSAPFGDFPRALLQKKFGRAAGVLRFGGNFLSGLGALGACLLLLHLFADWTPRQGRIFLVAGVGIVALLSVGISGVKVLAFVAACAFPVVALAWSGWPQAMRRASTGAASMQAVRRAAVGISARALGLAGCGGIIVAALLNDWRFFSRAADFWGTKPAQMVPLGLAALLVAGGFSPSGVAEFGAAKFQRRARRFGQKFLARGFTIQIGLGCGALALALWLWMARSGNDSGLSVSDAEWRFRAWLEGVLIARPRNKEMFVAYPALALSVWGARRGFALAARLAGMVGIIAPIDALNSFCQADNPLALALWRSVLGAILGTLFGCALMGVVEVATARPSWAQLRAQLTPSPRAKRTMLALAAVALLFLGWRQWRLARQYAWLSAPAPEATWPWPQTPPETLSRGVRHWLARSPDGTTRELFEFDFERDPSLHFAVYDADQDDVRPFDNRVFYWRRGLAPTTRHLDEKTNGRLVAAWNGAFFGLANKRPRQADWAFHLAPVVLNGRAFYTQSDHRWTVGALKRGPRFEVVHLPSKAQLAGFQNAMGCAQCVMKDGRALEMRPFPYQGEMPLRSPVASTPQEAGHIPTLDFMKTSRVSLGWNRGGSKLWLLFVKEPDGEDSSRAAVLNYGAAYGGWKLDDVQRFWLAMRDQMGAQSAVVTDGGDVAQLAFRRQNGFELVPPRFSMRGGTATQRFKMAPDGHDAPASAQLGGALMYGFIYRVPETKGN